MQAKGCTRILAKELSTNDNSKNQVYLGPDFDVLHYFPDLRVNQMGKKVKPPTPS